MVDEQPNAEAQVADGGKNAQMQDEAQAGGLPEWVNDPQRAYAEIQKLRDENAGRRQELQELKTWREQVEAERKQAEEQQQLEQGKYKELLEQRERELQELRQSMAQRERETLLARIADEYGLPPIIAKRLTGDSEDDLRADAESLRAALPSQPANDVQDETQDAKSTSKTQQPSAGRSTASAPGGRAVAETIEQRRARIYGRKF